MFVATLLWFRIIMCSKFVFGNIPSFVEICCRVPFIGPACRPRRKRGRSRGGTGGDFLLSHLRVSPPLISVDLDSIYPSEVDSPLLAVLSHATRLSDSYQLVPTPTTTSDDCQEQQYVGLAQEFDPTWTQGELPVLEVRAPLGISRPGVKPNPHS